MSQKYAVVDDNGINPTFYSTDITPASQIPAAAIPITDAIWQQWVANQKGLMWNGSALVAYTPPTPALTLAQQAAAMLAAGCQIVSTSNAALSGTYACDEASQGRLNRMYSLISRNAGAFPAGLTSLPWPDAFGGVHVFATAAEFLAFESAIGGFVLALDLIISTNAGTLPSLPITIA